MTAAGSIPDVPGQKNEARAGSPSRFSLPDKSAKRFNEVELSGQLADGRALASRNNQGIEVFQLLGGAHFADGRAQSPKHIGVLDVISLQGKDSDRFA